MNVPHLNGVNRFVGRLTPCRMPLSVKLLLFGPYPDQSCHSLLAKVSRAWESHTSCTNCTPAATWVSLVCQIVSIFAWLILSVLYCSPMGTTCEPMMYGFWPR